MKYLVFLLTVLLVIGGGFVVYFLADVFLPNFGAENVWRQFVVAENQTAGEISGNLHKAGFIDSEFNFKLYLKILGREDKIKAGLYRINPHSSLRELVNAITEFINSGENKVTIIEGWTNKQLAEYLADNFFSVADQDKKLTRDGYIKDFLEATEENYDYAFLASKPPSVDLEGYLFPDTYNFFADAVPGEIIKRMLGNFDKKLTPALRQKIESSGRTIHEVVTMASILEKEVASSADRQLVADILWRRLKVGMPLQADSTVNYITGKKTPSISSADKKIDSPYNTYKYPGLPPGPINNPGLDAITAAASPTANDHWYFLTTPEGKVIYSKTLAEHNDAKAKYLK